MYCLISLRSHAPHELYTYMRRCLALEMEVIQSAMGTPYIAQPQTERKYSEVSIQINVRCIRDTGINIFISLLW